MGIGDLFGKLVKKKGDHLTWFRLADDHVDGQTASVEIGVDEGYFLLRMKEMYIKHTRKLWREFYPMLHSYVEHQKVEEHEIAGPGQLKELGDGSLDRIVNINYRLAGPTPYRGEGVNMLVGLYSVPGKDAAKALISTVSQIASLGGVTLGATTEIAKLVKQGVEEILGLNESRLELGVRDTFFPGNDNPLRAGYHVGIAKPVDEIDRAKLWLREGRLVHGNDPIASRAYEDDDYLVLQVERRERRDDWPGLPEISEHQVKFSAILKDPTLSDDEKRARLGKLWSPFTAAVHDSKHLITKDKERIALSVQKHIERVLDAAGNPFESRSWGDAAEAVKVEGFSFVDVPDYLDEEDPDSVARAKEALAGKF